MAKKDKEDNGTSSDLEATKAAKLDLLVSQLSKDFGAGTIMSFTDGTLPDVQFISSGAIALDKALGGGYPRGRIVEIWGAEGSGKTSLALHAIAEAQKLGGTCLFIDAEHSLSLQYAQALGVDTSKLLFSQPDSGETALQVLETAVRSGAIDVAVVDSVAALLPRAELEGQIGDQFMGLQARLMSQAMRKLAGATHTTNTLILFLNQTRSKIGVMFGSPVTVAGGNALKFYASQRLEVIRTGTTKEDEIAIANTIKVKVGKNKCLTGDSIIFDPTLGQVFTLEEIVNSSSLNTVYALDNEDNKVKTKKVLARLKQGTQKVVGIILDEGIALRATPDHLVMTPDGWTQLGELKTGDYIARPRAIGGFGTYRPISTDEARILGYLIGDGYVGGSTELQLINAQKLIQDDAAKISQTLGCKTRLEGLQRSFTHEIGKKNHILKLVKEYGIFGHLAPTKRVPSIFFRDDISEELVKNLIFGLWETDGWVSHEQGNGSIRCGLQTTSRQLAYQLHFLLLKWGVTSSIGRREPGKKPSTINGRKVQGKLPSWVIRISGLDNIKSFLHILPLWGPRGQHLEIEFGKLRGIRDSGSTSNHLCLEDSKKVYDYLRSKHIGYREILSITNRQKSTQRSITRAIGWPRCHRDKVSAIAIELDDQYLKSIVQKEIYYDKVVGLIEPEEAKTYDLTIEGLSNFIANDIIVHNCAPPYREAEFSIVFGKGIDQARDFLCQAQLSGLVEKKGSWYAIDGKNIAQGEDGAIEYLESHPEVLESLKEGIAHAN